MQARNARPGRRTGRAGRRERGWARRPTAAGSCRSGARWRRWPLRCGRRELVDGSGVARPGDGARRCHPGGRLGAAAGAPARRSAGTGRGGHRRRHGRASCPWQADDALTWQEFETYIAQLCRRDDCREVVVSGKSGDLGVDVVGLLADGRKLVIQAKSTQRTGACPRRTCESSSAPSAARAQPAGLCRSGGAHHQQADTHRHQGPSAAPRVPRRRGRRPCAGPGPSAPNVRVASAWLSRGRRCRWWLYLASRRSSGPP
ncbi:restriction endonuclease [Streptomyces sp. CS62]|uniref:restriction endonuclease n=1 Tax=Streptomyces sp. CS62 TaxID=3119268 RepID=UPI003FA6AF55